MRHQAHRLLKLGAKAVLIKGGHGGGERSVDLLVDEEGVARLDDRVDGPLAQQRRSVPGQQPRGGGVVADGPQRAQGQRGFAVRRVPPGGAGVQARRSASVSGSEASATSRIRPVGANQPSSGSLSANSPRRASDPSASGAPSTPSAAHSAGMDALQRRGDAHQLAHARRLLREHLARQVAEQRRRRAGAGARPPRRAAPAPGRGWPRRPGARRRASPRSPRRASRRARARRRRARPRARPAPRRHRRRGRRPRARGPGPARAGGRSRTRSSAREARTTCRASGAWRHSASTACIAAPSGASAWRSSSTSASGRRRRSCRASDSAAAKASARALLVGARVRAARRAGRRRRGRPAGRARAGAARRPGRARASRARASSGPSVYQATSWRCAQAASSVDLPTPAPAMTVVTRRLRAWSRRACSCARGSAAGASGAGRILVLSVIVHRPFNLHPASSSSARSARAAARRELLAGRTLRPRPPPVPRRPGGAAGRPSGRRRPARTARRGRSRSARPDSAGPRRAARARPS